MRSSPCCPTQAALSAAAITRQNPSGASSAWAVQGQRGCGRAAGRGQSAGGSAPSTAPSALRCRPARSPPPPPHGRAVPAAPPLAAGVRPAAGGTMGGARLPRHVRPRARSEGTQGPDPGHRPPGSRRELGTHPRGDSVAARAPLGRTAMGSPTATPQLLYRSTRLLRTAFQHLHQQQQRADVFCDVVLWAEGEAVVAHCSVLSVCSPFFMEQLGRELPPQGCRVVLELAGLKIGVLRKLVRFFYTAELEVTQEEVHEVLAAARRLRVTELESLQLWGGRLVRLGPQRQLDRSCLHSTQEVPPVVAPDTAEPGSASSGVSPQRQPHSVGHAHPSPIGRMRLRKVERWGCWEVVREVQPPTVPPPVLVGDEGVTEARPPTDEDAREQVSKCSPPRQPPSANGMQQGGDSPVSPQGSQQAAPPGTPGSDSKEEEEVDVGTGELLLLPGTVCLWPSPSSESEEEVDVLT